MKVVVLYLIEKDKEGDAIGDDMAMMFINGLVDQFPDWILKANVYDDGLANTTSFVPESEQKFHLGFVRHIGAVGGPMYGG